MFINTVPWGIDVLHLDVVQMISKQAKMMDPTNSVAFNIYILSSLILDGIYQNQLMLLQNF